MMHCYIKLCALHGPSGDWLLNMLLCDPAEDVLTEQQTGQLLRVVPQREGHRLDLQWAVPPEQHVYRATPCGYLGHLIGLAPEHDEVTEFCALVQRARTSSRW